MKKLLFALIFTFSILHSQLSIALIARGVGPFHGGATPGTTCVMTATGTTTGRMLVIVSGWYLDAANTISSITVSGESNATVIAGSFSENTSGQSRAQIAYLANLTSGGTKTVTITYNTATYSSCSVMEYSGQDTASQPDTSGTLSNYDPAGTTSCVSSITTVANALIVAICENTGATVTAGSGYTLWGGLPATGGTSIGQVEDKVDAGTAGSEAVTFTGPYLYSHISMASFKVSGGGGGGPAPNATVRGRIQ